MNQSIPTPKLAIISSDRHQQYPQPQVKDPADFRWGFVEEFLRSGELSVKTEQINQLI